MCAPLLVPGSTRALSVHGSSLRGASSSERRPLVQFVAAGAGASAAMATSRQRTTFGGEFAGVT